jgi:bacillithiol system protein YtxJ
MLIPAKTEIDFQELLEKSKTKPVFLMKHSKTCSISAAAYREVQTFEKSHPDVDTYINLVIEDRPLTQKITQYTGITHESPQAILFRNGKPVWNASHGDIYVEALEEELKKIASH